jgi:hypothetical protein
MTHSDRQARFDHRLDLALSIVLVILFTLGVGCLAMLAGYYVAAWLA